MKKVLLSIILLIAVVQGTWATAYKYYIVEKSGSTLFFKGSDTAPSGKFQWNITDNSLIKWTWLERCSNRRLPRQDPPIWRVGFS